MDQRICCVTGPRDISDDKMDYVAKELRAEVAQAIEEGFTIFLSGFSDGTDLLFAEVIVEEKSQHPELSLEAAILIGTGFPPKMRNYRGCLPPAMRCTFSRSDMRRIASSTETAIWFRAPSG